MAQYFNLVVQCGRDEEEAEQMAEYFRNVVLKFDSGLTMPCLCWIEQDLQGFWWTGCTPLGASYGSCIEGDKYLLDNGKQHEELRNLLYQNLHDAPLFRCAIAAWETQDMIFSDENPPYESFSFADFDVLCDELWSELQRPAEYSFFKEGYVIKAFLPQL